MSEANELADLCESAETEAERLTRELDITNADHIALWLEANMPDAALGWLACRIVEAHEAVLRNPPAHKYWAAGEPDCPRELKCSNGELHTLRCKVCGNENLRSSICCGRLNRVNSSALADLIADTADHPEPETDAPNLTETLVRLSVEATAGEWNYRPDEHDDWGVIKSQPGGQYGFRCVLAQFRDPDALDEETLNQHRAAKTDPWAANAQFVCELVNSYRAGFLTETEDADPLAGVDALAARRALLDAGWTNAALDALGVQ